MEDKIAGNKEDRKVKKAEVQQKNLIDIMNKKETIDQKQSDREELSRVKTRDHQSHMANIQNDHESHMFERKGHWEQVKTEQNNQWQEKFSNQEQKHNIENKNMDIKVGEAKLGFLKGEVEVERMKKETDEYCKDQAKRRENEGKNFQQDINDKIAKRIRENELHQIEMAKKRKELGLMSPDGKSESQSGDNTRDTSNFFEVYFLKLEGN